jgi:nucleotide-binding universal stress UspA family protein
LLSVEQVKYYNILVPVNGTEVDQVAIQLACGLAEPNESKIGAAYIIVVSWALPLDAAIESEIAKAEDVLDYVECLADEEGVVLKTDILQVREAGLAIVDEAVEREADLIIMGVSSKTRFGVFSIGNEVPYVLKNAPCPVLLCQQPAD